MSDVVFETSGTSGAPKRVVRTEATLDADARGIVAAFPEVWKGAPLVVSSARRDHLLGHLWCERAPRLAGCRVHPEVITSVEALVAACRTASGAASALFVTTPSFLAKAAAHPDFASLRGRLSAVVVSGGPLSAETVRAVVDATGVCPLEIYGSTEAGTVAWRRQSADGELCRLQAGVEATAGPDGALVVDSPYAMARPLVLSDAVAFAGPRRFRLLGRLDRRVKVLEEFVSLPAVEAAFAAHPFVAAVRVEAFGGDVPRLGALVVPSATGREALASGASASVAATLRRDLLPGVGERAFPRRVRFVRELPVDARGKTTARDARAALSAWCREPAVLDWAATGARLDATLVFLPDCECFRGHFPGRPILPGVAQAFFVRHFARQAFPDFPDRAEWRRLKFQRLVRPGERVALSVERCGEGRFAFALSVGVERAARGEVRAT